MEIPWCHFKKFMYYVDSSQYSCMSAPNMNWVHSHVLSFSLAPAWFSQEQSYETIKNNIWHESSEDGLIGRCRWVDGKKESLAFALLKIPNISCCMLCMLMASNRGKGWMGTSLPRNCMRYVLRLVCLWQECCRGAVTFGEHSMFSFPFLSRDLPFPIFHIGLALMLLLSAWFTYLFIYLIKVFPLLPWVNPCRVLLLSAVRKRKWQALLKMTPTSSCRRWGIIIKCSYCCVFRHSQRNQTASNITVGPSCKVTQCTHNKRTRETRIIPQKICYFANTQRKVQWWLHTVIVLIHFFFQQ